MGVDLDWILPQLAVGGCVEPVCLPDLARAGIRRVVDLRVEAKDDECLLRAHAIELLHLPTVDGCAVTQDHLDRGVQWVNAQLDIGHRVLVHCQHGIGRSALLACCVLVSRGRTPADALELAKDRRDRISPSPEQLDALILWSTRWHRANGQQVAPCTLEALGQIAYRHLTVPPPAAAYGRADEPS